MMTIEEKTRKKCCLYASDFHLEMILLPYIKERINKSKFIIITQNDLSDTIKILLERVNIDKADKEKILNLNWNKSCLGDILDISNDNKELNIIINGDYNFVENINKKIGLLNASIIDCFSVSDKNVNINSIKDKYGDFLNTSKI